jgi:hypothetical protein
MALATYPASWQDKYAAEIFDVLHETATATTRGRLPWGEVAALMVRGIAMRARISLAFWGGIVVVGLFIWASSIEMTSFWATGAWNDFFIRSASGLAVALPVVAALAAIRGHRSKRVMGFGARARAARMARDCWPFLAAIVMGWLIAFVSEVVEVPAPSVPDGNPLILLSLVAISAGAISVGYAVGTFIHPVLAVPALLGCLFWWFLTPTWLGNDSLKWSNVTGYNLFSSTTGLGSVPVPQALLVVPVGALSAVAIAAGIVTLSVEWMRRVASLLVVSLVITGGVLFSPQLLKYVGAQQVGARIQSDMVCSGAAPRVCIWPEQLTVPGISAAQETLNSAYKRAAAVGLIMPTSIVPGETNQPVHKATTMYFWGSATDTNQLVVSYATRIADDSTCYDRASEHDLLAAEYSTAVIMGVQTSRALPSIQQTPADSDRSMSLAKGQVATYLGVKTASQAEAIAVAWNAGQCHTAALASQ